jgi:magnesium transporter
MQITTFDFKGLHKLIDADLKALRNTNEVVWIDVNHPAGQDLNRLQSAFGFHPLAMEDTRNQHQRPKVEEYADHLFIITNNVVYQEDELHFQEIDIFLGRNYIVTIHDECTPVMNEIRNRMNHTTTFKHVSSEYLLYILLDTIVDAYFPILDSLDNEIEHLGERVFENSSQAMLKRIFELKHMLNEAWYVAGQERDMFSVLTRREEDLITHHDVLEYYLRDVNDHLIRIGSIIGVLREDLKNIVDLYVSSTSNRLNTVVNRLAIITILIGVLTVISGFYGMNFETTWPPFSADWGVLFVLGLMVVLTGGILIVFRRMGIMK